MKKLLVVSGLVAATVFPTFAIGQEAPAPHASPRTPVQREQRVAERRAIQSRDVEGPALIIDGEKLRVQDVDLRLFGVVPPQLSASFGPQARSALDAVASGQNVSCNIRDRDHDGRLLATCKTASGTDLALELLKRGLAVSARGSLADTEFAQPYIAAETAAQNQRLGLWSVAIPAAASVTAVMVPDAASAQTAQDDLKKVEVAKAEAAKQEVLKAEQAKADAAKAEQLKADLAKAEQAKIEATKAVEKAAEAAHALPAGVSSADLAVNASPGFFARYQLLLASLITLMTAGGIVGALLWQRRQERADDLKALAAALRGELMAARAVCLTRIKTIFTDEDDRETVWPRLRATLYQAYVGKVGALGAELARQIASIYGQASDYAAYYNNSDEATTPKRQALGILIKHIEEVLPRLAQIEETGQRMPGHGPAALPPAAPLTARKLASQPVPSADPKTLSITSMPRSFERKASNETVTKLDGLTEEKPDAQLDTKTEPKATSIHVTSEDTHKAAEEVTASAVVLGEGIAAETLPVKADVPIAAAILSAPPSAPQQVDPAETELAAGTSSVATAGDRAHAIEKVSQAAPGALWDSLRRFAREHLAPRSANDDPMAADYAALIEQDIANMTFDDEDESMTTADFLRKSGVR